MCSNDTTIWKPYCVKMFKSLADGTTPSNFIIIEDVENCAGLDLFIAFLAKHASSSLFKNINLICYEYPPEYYLPKNSIEKITCFNYFKDPLNWNNGSGPKTDLSAFLSNNSDAETVFFIDSISCAVILHKFFTVYKNLARLKKLTKVIALVHSDLLTLENVEALESLSNTIVLVDQCIYTKGVSEKTITVTHKKLNRKVTKQKEIVTIDEDLNISCKKQAEEKSSKGGSDVTKAIQSLSTFKLGFNMSESEKKARDELVLPYLRAQGGLGSGGGGGGEIIYQPDDDELEDPDEDLEI